MEDPAADGNMADIDVAEDVAQMMPCLASNRWASGSMISSKGVMILLAILSGEEKGCLTF